MRCWGRGGSEVRGINRLIPWWSGPPGSRIDESTIVGLYQNILKKKKKGFLSFTLYLGENWAIFADRTN